MFTEFDFIRERARRWCANSEPGAVFLVKQQTALAFDSRASAYSAGRAYFSLPYYALEVLGPDHFQLQLITTHEDEN